MSRLPSGVLCGVASLMLMYCAFHLSAHESAWAGLFVALIGVGFLLIAVASLKASVR